MGRVQSVLCPVDFSEHSRRAFEYAVALAAYHHARLTVLSVLDPLLAQAAAVHCDLDYLHESKAELRAFVGDTSLETISWAPTPRLVVTVGHPGDQVLEVARLHEADLIVMGTQGLGGLRKFVFGSTTDRVLRRAEVPVLAVPLGGVSLVSLEREGPAFGVERVIGAIDLRPGSLALARMAAGVARDFHASLILLHVVPAVQATSRWRTTCDEATSLHVQTAVAGLEDIAQRLAGSPPADTVVTTGQPADAVTQLAVQRRAQLIVIGTGAGENGANRPGSTAYRVLCASAVPVLAVPPVSARRAEMDRESTTSEAPLKAPETPGNTWLNRAKGRRDQR
jgi:nucleotide-binding universal stress UspA family protein